MANDLCFFLVKRFRDVKLQQLVFHKGETTPDLSLFLFRQSSVIEHVDQFFALGLESQTLQRSYILLIHNTPALLHHQACRIWFAQQ
jgi:hypothetical protein